MFIQTIYEHNLSSLDSGNDCQHLGNIRDDSYCRRDGSRDSRDTVWSCSTKTTLRTFLMRHQIVGCLCLIGCMAKQASKESVSWVCNRVEIDSFLGRVQAFTACLRVVCKWLIRDCNHIMDLGLVFLEVLYFGALASWLSGGCQEAARPVNLLTRRLGITFMMVHLIEWCWMVTAIQKCPNLTPIRSCPNNSIRRCWRSIELRYATECNSKFWSQIDCRCRPI